MKKSLMKLVDVVIQKLQELPEGSFSESRLRSWLSQKGYSNRDIDAAIQAVRPRYAFAHEIVHAVPSSPRQLSSYESFKLAPDARDALARLDLYQLIDPYERELIMERLDQFEGPVGMEELEYLVSWIVCSTRDVEHQQTIFSVLNGKERNLH